MNGNYSIFAKSMNGVVSISDGISLIQNGIASHENIIYNDYIKSSDNTTSLTNDTLDTDNVICDNITAININGTNETVDTLNCTNLNCDETGFIVDGTTNMITSNFPQVNNSSLTIQQNSLNMYDSNINQTGAPTKNILKDTEIIGLLETSNITQKTGSTILKNINCDNITMSSNSSITQNGSTIGNSFGSTTVNVLNILQSISLPADITISGARYTDDLDMVGGSRITQDVTSAGANYNTFMYSKFSKLDVSGNLNVTGTTTNLLNTIINGISTLNGDIIQSGGVCTLLAISCNQLSLNSNKDLFFSLGTGKINQSVCTAGVQNLLNDILMNSNSSLTMRGTGIISQSGTSTNSFKNTVIFGTFGVTGLSSLNAIYDSNNRNNNHNNSNNGNYYKYIRYYFKCWKYYMGRI